MAINNKDIDPAIIRWCGQPKVFVAKSRMAIRRLACADYRGKDIGGFDVGFMGSVNELGFIERCTQSGGFILEISPKTT